MVIGKLRCVIVRAVICALPGLLGVPNTRALPLTFNNPWSAVASMPGAEAQMAAAADTATGDIYVAGGYDGTNTLSTLDVYNPVLNAWTAEASLPTAVRQAAAAYSNGRIFVFGGMDSGGSVNQSVQIYSIATNSWSTAAFSAGTGGAAAIAAGASIYIAGGNSAGTQAVAFDPSTLASMTLPFMPQSRTGQGAAFLGNELLEYGGYDVNTASVLASGSNFIPAQNTWGPGFPPMSLGRLNFAYGTLQGQIVAAGGSNSLASDTGTSYSAFESYDPAQNAWYTQPSLPLALRESAGAVSGNRFYVIGGVNAGGISSGVYRITAVPEPAGLALLVVCGLTTLTWRRWGGARMRQQAP